MKKIKKLAILVNGEHKVMGTFSKGYIEDLPYEKIVLFGGLIPIFKNGTPRWKQKLIRYWIALLAFNNPKRIEKIKIKRLSNILKSEKINVVLCEFLNTGASALPAIKLASLKNRANAVSMSSGGGIPLISNILGYEINVKEIVERFKTKYEDLAKYKSYAIPVARDMIPKLKLLGFNEENITFSPIGPTDDVFEISPNFESLQFLAIGRFTETKAPHNTILAFNEVLKKFPDAKLVMAGSGEMMDFCVNLVEELGIKDKVNFIGWISKEQMKKLFLESSVFVQHSVTAKNGDKEGTPVVILEASAAGLPIVSTFHAGIPDTVIHEETGFLVEENDWKSMARYMQELLLDKELYQNMSIKGKEFVRSHFSMKAHLEVIQNIIESILTF